LIDPLLATWRDLIMRHRTGGPVQWFVSPLEDHTYEVTLTAGVQLHGYRLKPGVRIDECSLLAAIQQRQPERDELQSYLSSFSQLSTRIAEALPCLASDVGSVAQAANRLGVTPRTLQRLVTSETSRTPVYWLQLARVRRAARDVHRDLPLAEIADLHGYSDQAHMTREFKRWLSISPTSLRADAGVSSQLYEPGYD